MRSLRVILIASTAILCLGFGVQFGLSEYERLTWPEPTPGFSMDAVPQYTVGVYHGLSFFLLLSLIFARKHVTALLLSAGYIIVHALATYVRLRTGFFGGDMCPEGGLCSRAILRASWFDWTATGLLLIIFSLVIASLFLQGRNRRLQSDQTPRPRS